MSRKIVALSAYVSGNKKVYVKSLDDRDDKKKNVNTTFDKNEAMDFKTEVNAKERALTFHNPMERHYYMEKIEVAERSFESIRETSMN